MQIIDHPLIERIYKKAISKTKGLPKHEEFFDIDKIISYIKEEWPHNNKITLNKLQLKAIVMARISTMKIKGKKGKERVRRDRNSIGKRF